MESIMYCFKFLTLIVVVYMSSQHLMLNTQVMFEETLPHSPGLGLLHHPAPHALHPPMEHCLVQHLLCGAEREKHHKPTNAMKYTDPIMSMGLVMCLTPSSMMLDMHLQTSDRHWWSGKEDPLFRDEDVLRWKGWLLEYESSSTDLFITEIKDFFQCLISFSIWKNR